MATETKTTDVVEEQLTGLEWVFYSLGIALVQLFGWAAAAAVYLFNNNPWHSPQVGKSLHKMWYTLTSEQSQLWTERIAYSAAVLLLVLMLYTWASFECWMGRDCTFASTHWTQWLWENFFSKSWWPK